MKEIVFPLAVLAVLLSMLVPLPTVLMDFLLVANLLLALVLVISAFSIADSLKLSALPTMLLLATLFRLALNVACTRLILTHGEAGAVIEAFGSIVIQGNLIVGVVIFAIITLIQFIVIAKGSERVAEVAARFTLDALPGKQMSIDADVRAGLIDFETARMKRQELQIESRFYGALDGAMKFVKGDAVAGLIVVVINMLGGFAMGIFVDGLEISQAFSKYTILTVGDGLVAQIPALLNSFAAGMVITRVARGDGMSLARELLAQIGQERQAKYIIAALSFLVAFVPGMPSLPFICLAMVLFLAAVYHSGGKRQEVPVTREFIPRTAPVLEVLMGEKVALLNSREWTEALGWFQEQIYERFGLILALPECKVYPAAGTKIIMKSRGIKVFEREIIESDLGKAAAQVAELLITTVAMRVTDFVDDIHTRRILDYFEREAPEIVSNIVPALCTVTQLTSILKALLNEGITVRHFDIILQAVGEGASRGLRERALLAETRVALRRVISERYQNTQGVIAVHTIDPLLDLAFAAAEAKNIPIEAELLSRFLEQIERVTGAGMVLVVSKGSRQLVSDTLKMRGLNLTVLAHEEIGDDVKMERLSHIALDAIQNAKLIESVTA